MEFQLPRMSSRRWFWTFFSAAILWSFFGTRSENSLATTGNPTAQSAFRQFQSFVQRPFTILLIPGEVITKAIEGVAVIAIERVTAVRDDAATVPQLQEQVRTQEAKIAMLTGENKDLYSRLSAYETLKNIGFRPAEMLAANCVSFQGGPGTSSVHLDKGAMDGVAQGMPVVDARDQVTILGRIAYVGQKDSDVQLLSDPKVILYADIVRLTPPPNSKAYPLTRQPCLIKGLGGSELQCDTIDKQAVVEVPQPGDLVCLVAKDSWPAYTNHMVIGQIDQVRFKEDQPLRYDIRTRLTQTQLHSVVILLKP